MSDDVSAKVEQVSAQCRAVAHLAREISDLYRDHAEVMRHPNSVSILDLVGARTAAFMEQLGEMLNATDAATEDDDWLEPIFAKAQELWPTLPEGAPMSAADGWQSIATAPSDGRKVLVIGGWRKEADIAQSDGDWWRTRRNEGGKGVPTHWQPLPAPPAPEPDDRPTPGPSGDHSMSGLAILVFFVAMVAVMLLIARTPSGW